MRTSIFASLWTIIVLLFISIWPLFAEQFGPFTYEVVENTFVTITGYPDEAVGEVEIPAEINGKPVTVIGEGAFAGCNRLTSVTLPESITRIEGAHRWFHTVIGKGAFEDCEELTAIRIPQSVTDIGGYAFKGCKSLRSIALPDGVSEIPHGMFYGCESLTSIVIPKSVIAICYGCENGLPAFSGCRALEAIVVEPGNRNYTSVDGVLFDAGMETAIRCPEGKMGTFAIPQGVKSVAGVWAGLDTSGGEGAFQNCTRLTDVIIPESVTKIGRQAFLGCSSLRSVIVPDGVTQIDYAAFSGCSNLRSVRLPNSVTWISDGAFENCGFTTFTIPPSVWYIGYLAFSGCTNLTSITIPSSVVSLNSSFSGCKALSAIVVEAGNRKYSSIDGILYSVPGTILIRCPEGKAGHLTIPDRVTLIGSKAFEGCGGLTAIHVEAGNRKYSSIDGILYSVAGTILIRYPEGKVGHLTISDRVTKIGLEALEGCTGLMSIEVDAQNANYRSLGGVLFDKGGTTLIQYPAGRSGDYTIPEGVTHIGKNAFSGCRGLTSVTIPGSLTYLPDDTFKGCSGLTSIEVDAQNPRYSSLDGVLFNKDRTELIRYPAGRSGDYTIPESVTSIVSTECSGWGGLTGCGGEGAFGGSSKLTGVSIPAGVTSIGAETFEGCTSLTTVTIPASVTFMGHQGDEDRSYDFLSGAFEDCTNLRSAFFLGDAPRRFDWNTFTNAAPGFTIFYPGCSTGFTSPTWNGYPAVRVDEQTCPQAAWLTEHGFAYDTDLYQDLNGDGVSLLMAYALDLDPHQNLRNRLPSALPVEDGMVMVFHAASRGVAYEAQTSTDLQHWTSEGISLSDLGADNQITASMAFDEPNRFMRLVITEE